MSEWISVKERLPEEGKSVLIFGKGWDEPEIGRLESIDAEGFYWTDTDGDDQDWSEEFLPTHWQPLPEPPKEDE